MTEHESRNVMKEEAAVVSSPLINIKAAIVENGITHTEMLLHVKSKDIQWHVFSKKKNKFVLLELERKTYS